ncbi:MAG: hypothetical protein ACRC80_17180 [Waterburya sp.]
MKTKGHSQAEIDEMTIDEFYCYLDAAKEHQSLEIRNQSYAVRAGANADEKEFKNWEQAFER